MKEQGFSPEQGFETIASVIREAKAQFEEDGIIYVGWGILTAIAAFTQYYLIHNGHVEINYYPYFLMPIGAIVTAIYSAQKEKKGKKTHLSRIIGATWAPISISVMVLGFVLGAKLGAALMPIILLLLSFGLMVSGAAVKSDILLYSGVLMNLIGFFSFSLDYAQQPLMMGIASVLCVLIPGVLLMRNHKKNNV